MPSRGLQLLYFMLTIARGMLGSRFRAGVRMMATLSQQQTASALSPAPFPNPSPPRGADRVLDIRQHRFSVAPMMDYTDCHQRKLQRMISSESVLYTEMVVANALVRTDKQWRFLEADFSIEEPLVLQLGGSDPKQMYDAAKIAHGYGYRQMNINVGCPSEKVAGAGCFGAALMLNPQLVAELAMSIYVATGVPASVKCRIGVDDHDSYEELQEFVRIVSERGKVSHFIIHARKAVLGAKFTPDDNRKIPKLKYDFVYSLVKDFPHLYFSINGGVLTMEDCAVHLSMGCIGVMVGRQVINNPFYWRSVDNDLYSKQDSSSRMNRKQILERYCSYASDTEMKQGEKVRRALIKPLFQLFNAETNGKQFRILMDKYVSDSKIGIGDAIHKSSQCLTEETLTAL